VPGPAESWRRRNRYPLAMAVGLIVVIALNASGVPFPLSLPIALATGYALRFSFLVVDRIRERIRR